MSKNERNVMIIQVLAVIAAVDQIHTAGPMAGVIQGVTLGSK